MTWTIPTTVKVGDIIDASLWNTYGRDNLNSIYSLATKFSETVLSSSQASPWTLSGLGSFTQFTHLLVLANFRSDGAGTTNVGFSFRFNGDTGNNYSYLEIDNGAYLANAVNGNSIALGNIPASNATTNLFSLLRIYIPSFLSTTFHKIADFRQGANLGSGSIDLYEVYGHWQSTSALSSMTFITSDSSNFISGSFVSFYGLN